MTTVIIYGKAGWPFTTKAREAHEGHQYVDVKESDKNMQKMLATSNGERKVPVIVKNDTVTIGFDGT